MRAMQISELGQPLRLADVPVPEPGPGEVLLRVAACGINFADTLMVAGRYQEKPRAALRPGPRGLPAPSPRSAPASPPRRRAPASPRLRRPGGLAEYVAVAGGRCIAACPTAMPDEVAAAFPIAYGTSHVALAWLARLRPARRCSSPAPPAASA